MIKLNLGCGANELLGFTNLDKETGWTFQQGLPYRDGKVDAITISHALMYVPALEWPSVFRELARVLAADGVIRVTEDNTSDPSSPRYKGHYDAVTLTSPELVIKHFHDAGLIATVTAPDVSAWDDDTLIQRFHGEPPKVFHVEALHI